VSYIDVAEEVGAAYDAGLIDRDTAVLTIYAAANGGLTLLGADDTLNRWQTLRAQWAKIRMDAELGIAAIEAGRRRRRNTL